MCGAYLFALFHCFTQLFLFFGVSLREGFQAFSFAFVVVIDEMGYFGKLLYLNYKSFYWTCKWTFKN